MKKIYADGLLFIGDPHLSSRRPGRRTDINFAGTVLNKLAQALDIARENRLQPAILGDLFDRAGEQDLLLLSGLLHLLRDHHQNGGLIPVTLAGNHDMKDATLSGDTALAVIQESGLLQVLDDAVPFPVYSIRPEEDADCIATLVPYAYGQEYRLLGEGLPDMPDHPGMVIALTHADFAFAGAYPGAKEIVEIPGVDMVVNGHMHKLCPTVRRGNTLWWNPGNITRMSMDCESHAPRVWSWKPGEDTLTGIHLRHEKIVFNRTGVSVKPDMDGLKSSMEDGVQTDMPISSRFVEMLKEQQAQESPLTEDASHLLSEIQSVCEEQKTSAVVSDILQKMLRETVLEEGVVN
ncbi:metallophosphoesterase [Acidithiobacillus albertensis]|uniref:metallophosphoesterase n=1 Tax=Acidithiobacillus albertensis TaxID=119978 RepID=UPI001C077A3B|nr:metallophosphoesterase [Acidithiobacillus albertensis]MBU2741872.1 hypothetical protein [Acidithiobacillus albertensis]